MDNKAGKRLERSLTFFAQKKSGKYKRQSRRKTGDVVDVDGRDERSRRASKIVSTVDGNSAENAFRINFILTDLSLILVDRFVRVFPSALTFLENLKSIFKNSSIILYTHNKTETIFSTRAFSSIDARINLDENSIMMSEERPVLLLRKYLVSKWGPLSLTGPNVLLTKAMNANNNKQYDVIKDVRRFYIFDRNAVRDVDYERLIEELRESIRQFFADRLP